MGKMTENEKLHVLLKLTLGDINRIINEYNLETEETLSTWDKIWSKAYDEQDYEKMNTSMQHIEEIHDMNRRTKDAFVEIVSTIETLIDVIF